MAFVTDIRTGGTSLLTRLTTWRAEMRARVEQYKVYRKTRDELNGLSKRELDDIGIGAGDIERIAREAAFS